MRVNTNELKTELEFINRFVEKKTTIPILAHVHLTAADGTLMMIGTDLELGGITSIDGEGGDPWTTTVPIKTLLRYLAKVEDREVDVACITTESQPFTREVPKLTEEGEPIEDAEGNPVRVEEEYTNKSFHLTLKHGGHSSIKMEAMDAVSFPALPIPSKMYGEIRGMKTMVPKVLCAVSIEESRFTLNGALLVVDPAGESQMVSTDGHRMSLVKADLTFLEPIKAIIGKNALYEAARMNGGSCYFGAEGEHQIFMSARRSIVARKLTGNFPDYERVVPKEFTHTIGLDKKDLTKTIERVSVFADERSRAIYLEIAESKMTVFASTHESGSAKGSIDATHAEAVPSGYKAGLNWSYVMDFLKLATDQVWFRTQDGNEKTGCVSTSMMFVDDSGWQYICMPMRI